MTTFDTEFNSDDDFDPIPDFDPDACVICGDNEGDIESYIDGVLSAVCERCALTLPFEPE